MLLRSRNGKSAETRADKSTETSEHSGWEEIWRPITITTFHQLQIVLWQVVESGNEYRSPNLLPS